MAFIPAPKLCYFQTKTELQGRKHRFKEKVSTFCFFTVYFLIVYLVFSVVFQHPLTTLSVRLYL